MSQKKILRNWINDARLLYNTTVGILANTSEKADKYKLRNDLVIEKNTTVSDPKILESMRRTPKDVRAKAVFEACVAHNLSIRKVKTANPEYTKLEKVLKVEKRKLKKSPKDEALIEGVRNLEEDLIFTPKMMAKTSVLNVRRLRDQYGHIFIPKTAVKISGRKLKIYPSYSLGSIITNKTLKEITSDFQIRWHKTLDVWHIITSESVNSESKSKSFNTIALDPGIRTFLTGVDSSGDIKEYGKDWGLHDKIKKRIAKMDHWDAISKGSLRGLRGRERFNSLKAKRNFDLHRRKLHNMINDLHKKTVVSLLDEYDVIILPKLRSKALLKGDLCTKTKRDISLISHCKFHDYISWKASIRGKTVINQNEAYTTQTCFTCGSLNNIGSSKVYTCKNCPNICDRDIQSCFNIMTRYMSSYSSTGSFSDLGDMINMPF